MWTFKIYCAKMVNSVFIGSLAYAKKELKSFLNLWWPNCGETSLGNITLI